MDIGQAVKRLLSGDKIKRVAWGDDEGWIEPDQKENTDLELTYGDLVATDWETDDG
jgi:hypothetical protein